MQVKILSYNHLFCYNLLKSCLPNMERYNDDKKDNANFDYIYPLSYRV